MRTSLRSILAAGFALGSAAVVSAQPPQAAPSGRLPVREVTVFKDGHAFVLHEGKMPVDGTGRVVLDHVPTPVIGTFWPYSTEKDVKLESVVAGIRRASVERTALSLRELLEANVGAPVTITEAGGLKYDATIVEIPERSGPELEATSPIDIGEQPPQKGEIILLRTGTGVKVVPLARIQDVTIRGNAKTRATSVELRNQLTLKLSSGQRQPRSAGVGMLYLQKGIRWIPGYKVTIDGSGNAQVRLQATLLNELTDLEDVTANLVVGVPTFAFQDTPDPISLQQAVAQLSQYFQRDSQTAYGFSNSIMTQGQLSASRMGERRNDRVPEAPPADLGPELQGSDRSEDLYVFTVRHVSLKRGQRMVLPVAEYNLKYRDVYTLDIPFSPPPEVRFSAGSEQQAALARLLAAPKVMHALRLKNSGPHPLTTAPALITRGDRVLAQGMMTYTSQGAETDLPITAALDVKVRKQERETKRTPNAASYQGTSLQRVDLEGSLELTNLRGQPVDLEVTRHVLGQVDSTEPQAQVRMVNFMEDGGFAAAGGSGQFPDWWRWYNWPHWWHYRNGVGRIEWSVKLEPNQKRELRYQWHYFAP